MLDYNKSVTLLTNSSKAITAKYLYDPYGQVTNGATLLPGTTGTPNGAGNGQGSQSIANPWRYTSGHQISPNGLIKMGARYYNPTLGRFTQPDPSGQEANAYAYAGNNPVTYNDPTGLISFWEAAAIGLVAGIVGVATAGLALPAVAVLTAGEIAAPATIGAGAAAFTGGVTSAVIDGGQDSWTESNPFNYYS